MERLVARPIAPALAERAREANLPIPPDVRAFVGAVDEDPTLRRALAQLGLHFEEDDLEIEIEIEIDGFVPLWSNGYGDGYGGLTKDGLAYLRVDERGVEPLPPIVEHVRATATAADEQATAEVVLAALVTLRPRA
ncbi:MAG: hypothetical protein KIT84_19180 [Labilithrix sp.]|nr:hypothetical protein [Labilithrix sp.]MCW5813158.1 hypothetical protein [Labilithrix sp.]